MIDNLMLLKIKEMHTKFGISQNSQIRLSQEEKQFRINCMLEEIQEYADSDNLKDELDALLDVIIFAMGTLERQGLLEVSMEAFNRIMKANLKKEIGTASKERQGGPAFKLDLVKPAGWEEPNFDDLIQDPNA